MSLQLLIDFQVNVGVAMGTQFSFTLNYGSTNSGDSFCLSMMTVPYPMTDPWEERYLYLHGLS